MVCYGIFLDQLSLTSILIPILCTLRWFFKFRYFYQRCGRRSTSIHPYSFISYIGHIKIHIISKNWKVPFGAFFLNWEKPIFSAKIPIFSIPVHDIGLKIRNLEISKWVVPKCLKFLMKNQDNNCSLNSQFICRCICNLENFVLLNWIWPENYNCLNKIHIIGARILTK